MGGCFNFSLVLFHQRQIQSLYKSCGLESRIVDLKDGTTMKCWIPQQNKEKELAVPSQKPPLVLLHAFGSNSDSWNCQVKPFSKLFDLYIPDLVFFGESTTTRPERTEIFQAECVAKMLELLHLPRYSLIGTSYGGFVAYRMAHLYPDQIDKLVISSSGVSMDPSSNQELVDRFNVNSINDIIQPTTIEGIKRVASMAFHKQLWFPIPNFIWDDYLQVVVSPHYEEKIGMLDSLVIGKADMPPLPVVPQDVLIVWGEFDSVFKLKWAYHLKDLSSLGEVTCRYTLLREPVHFLDPDLTLGVRLFRHIGEKAQVLVIKNAAHVPQVDKASEYNTKVIAYLTDGKVNA